VLSGYIAENRSQLTSATTSSREVSQQIKSTQSGIQSISEKIEANSEALQNEMNTLMAKREQLHAIHQKEANNEIDSRLESIQSKLSSSEDLVRKARDIMAELRSISNRNTKEIQFLESHSECPTCRQTITDDHKSSMTNELTTTNDETITKIQSIQEKINTIAETQGEYKAELDEINNSRARLNKISQALQLVDRDIKNLQSRLTEHTETDQLEYLKETLNTSIERLTTLQESIASMTELSQLYHTTKDFLSDDGIRRVVVAKYLPYIVARINHWLEKMDYHAVVLIDDNFEETIKVRGFDPTKYSALSSGEKAKLSLSLVIAFRELLEIKNNSNIQLLIIDELLENMDATSKTSLFWNLRSIAEQTETSIFIVSHAVTDNFDPFHRVLEVQKSGNFTKTREIDA
jgi:DNA repair exonuclease SbcCD ATPase subunit